MDNRALDEPVSVGLGGDGDEICAIEEVEREFGVKLDNSNASSWITAGDIYVSLQNELPLDERNSDTSWNRFAEAICLVTGVEPNQISKDSPLLVRGLNWGHIHTGLAFLMWPLVLIVLASLLYTVLT